MLMGEPSLAALLSFRGCTMHHFFRVFPVCLAVSTWALDGKFFCGHQGFCKL